jgi:hypothetical protein
MNDDDFNLLSKIDDIISHRFSSIPSQVFVVFYAGKRGSVFIEWLQRGNIHTTLLFTFDTIESFRSKAKEYIEGKRHV